MVSKANLVHLSCMHRAFQSVLSREHQSGTKPPDNSLCWSSLWNPLCSCKFKNFERCQSFQFLSFFTDEYRNIFCKFSSTLSTSCIPLYSYNKFTNTSACFDFDNLCTSCEKINDADVTASLLTHHSSCLFHPNS